MPKPFPGSIQRWNQGAGVFAFLVLAAMVASPSLADAPQNITFDDIKFDIEKDGDFKRSMLTDEIKKLNNEEIKLRGYILPTSVFKQNGIKQFVLVRDNMECCFGPGAAIYDCIIVEMKGSATASFTTLPVAVEGKFTISEYKVGKRLMAIYHLDGVSVSR